MNADVERAVEAADQACATYRLGFEGRRHWLTIRQHLLDQDAQIARLREDCASQQRIAIAEQISAEKAEAMLRKCRQFVAWATERLPEAMPVYDELNAHLGGEQ